MRTRSSYLQPDPGYEAVHRRIKVERGAARTHLCHGCGDQAEQWSYQYNKDNNIEDEQGRTYSKDSRDYMPLCVSCHRRYDRKSICVNEHVMTPGNTYVWNNREYCRECRRNNTRRARGKQE